MFQADENRAIIGLGGKDIFRIPEFRAISLVISTLKPRAACGRLLERCATGNSVDLQNLRGTGGVSM